MCLERAGEDFVRGPPGEEEGGRLNFLKFETDKIDTCIEFMKRLKKEYMQRNGSSEGKNDLCVMATGGGAYKYYDRIKEALGVEVMREDEMECLIIGRHISRFFREAAKLLTDSRT